MEINKEAIENRTLHLDYEMNYVDYRAYFLEVYRKNLPTTFAFFGTACLLSVLLSFIFDEKIFFLLFALAMAAIPITSFVLDYQNLVRHTKTSFKNMRDDEKTVHFTFREDADGFDSISGKNFSHLSWDSIVNVLDRAEHLIFIKKSGYFVIPKSAFRSVEEFAFLEYLVKTNVKASDRLLK